jgi:hypothetical protein
MTRFQHFCSAAYGHPPMPTRVENGHRNFQPTDARFLFLLTKPYGNGKQRKQKKTKAEKISMFDCIIVEITFLAMVFTIFLNTPISMVQVSI